MVLRWGVTGTMSLADAELFYLLAAAGFKLCLSEIRCSSAWDSEADLGGVGVRWVCAEQDLTSGGVPITGTNRFPD